MDLPVYLERCDFVSGRDELHQDIGLLLSTLVGGFLQDARYGIVDTGLHELPTAISDFAVREALKVIPNLKVNNVAFTYVDMQLNMLVFYTYNGVNDNYMFKINQE